MGIKIDIKKAFDTLEWDFIDVVLESFGFSSKFRCWIQNILHSAKISILINGTPKGFFACSRGVRQGDPLSPLLFGLAEDYLNRKLISLCETRILVPMYSTRKLACPSHLLYADDVIIFCQATRKNIRVIKSVFDLYGSISGQMVNWHKSEVFFSKHIPYTRMETLRTDLNMKLGALPFNYLGVPLFSGAPRRSWLQPIADKIISKFDNWKGKTLSMAGRLALVNSVILGSFLHSFSIYKWPTVLIKKMEKAIRNFIWTGSIHTKKMIAVKWEICCNPKEEGGIGIKRLHAMNLSLLSKLAWKVCCHDSFVFRFFRQRFYKSPTQPRSYLYSSVWTSIKHSDAFIRSNGQWSIGSDSNLSFWNDNWLGYAIADQIGISSSISKNLTGKVSDFFRNGKWHFTMDFRSNFPDICDDIERLSPSFMQHDEFIFKPSNDGKFSCKVAYDLIRTHQPKVAWGKSLWRHFLPPAKSFLLWRVLHNKIPTDDLLMKNGFQFASKCRLCHLETESINHIFITCQYAIEVWKSLEYLFDIKISIPSSFDEFFNKVWNLKFSSQIEPYWKVGFLSAIYYIWLVRNQATFHDIHISVSFTIRRIFCSIKATEWFKIGHMKNSQQDLMILRRLHVSPLIRTAPKIIKVIWIKPPMGWIKINTDGAARGSPGLSGAGGIFRNHEGKVLSSFMAPLGVGFAFEAELSAIILAVSRIHLFYPAPIWIESDSSYAVNLLQHRSLEVPWKIRNEWIKCLNTLRNFQVHISHIYREGNSAADHLAVKAINIGSIVWWNTFPVSCSSFIANDVFGKERYRFS